MSLARIKPRDAVAQKGEGAGAARGRHDAHDRRREPIAAAQDSHDYGLLAVTDGLTNVAYAMRQRFVRDDDIRPDRLEQLLRGHQAIRILHEIAQQLEALRPKCNLAIRGSQRVPRDIQRISLELEHLER